MHPAIPDSAGNPDLAPDLADETLLSRPAFRLHGRISAPGDKSISHRALMLATLADGVTHITGLLESGDIHATEAAMVALGARIETTGPGERTVHGLGRAGIQNPEAALDFGNAGTGVRLCFGLVAGQGRQATFTGDESLCQRPMNRVLEPLAKMGARATSQDGRLPVTLTGPNRPEPVQHEINIASAQVKSALILAGLQADGDTQVIEPHPTRAHTETMLQAFGADVQSELLPDGRNQVTLHGPARLQAIDIAVPGDPSSAAFATTAALIVPDSEIVVEGVMLAEGRDGLYRVLQDAGYDVTCENERQQAGENVADIRARYGVRPSLHTKAAQASDMIDEFPCLFVLAAFAEGKSRFEGLAELRVKESDRLAIMADLLRQYGVLVDMGEDWIEIHGASAQFGAKVSEPGADHFTAHGDHRIAMSAAILAMGGFAPLHVAQAQTISTSYPDFVAHMQHLGAPIQIKGESGLRIAVDGPLASGKGTIARMLARHFKLPYLDTGTLYRGTARAAIAAGVDLADEDKVADLAAGLDLPLGDPAGLRTADIGAGASKVAALPKVRAALMDLQRRFAARDEGAVLDGRDIGTVVCPDADVKLWITASEAVRASRRRMELAEKGEELSQDEMLQQLRERDARDAGREYAPMRKAVDAHLIDTSEMSIDAAFQAALDRVTQVLAEREG